MSLFQIDGASLRPNSSSSSPPFASLINQLPMPLNCNSCTHLFTSDRFDAFLGTFNSPSGSVIVLYTMTSMDHSILVSLPSNILTAEFNANTQELVIGTSDNRVHVYNLRSTPAAAADDGAGDANANPIGTPPGHASTFKLPLRRQIYLKKSFFPHETSFTKQNAQITSVTTNKAGNTCLVTTNRSLFVIHLPSETVLYTVPRLPEVSNIYYSTFVPNTSIFLTLSTTDDKKKYSINLFSFGNITKKRNTAHSLQVSMTQNQV